MEVLNTLAQGSAGHGIERAEGFVHQQKVRVTRQRARNADALALSTGQFMRHAGGECRVEFDQFEQFGNPGGGQALARKARPDADILRHIHMREQADTLEDIADPSPQFVRLGAADVGSVDQDRASVWFDQPVDRLEQGRLARTRRADQRKETATCDLERDIVDRQRIAEAFAQMFERNAGGGSGHGATLCAAGRGVKGGPICSPIWRPILPFAGRPSLGYALDIKFQE